MKFAWARDQLLNPEQNVRLLAGKLQRLKRELGLSPHGVLQASRSIWMQKQLQPSATYTTANSTTRQGFALHARSGTAWPDLLEASSSSSPFYLGVSN
jgi:hypothetical protein